MRVCFLDNAIFEGRYFSAGDIVDVADATELLIANGIAAPVQGESAEPEAEVEAVEEVARAVEHEVETVEVKTTPKRKPKARATKVEDAIAAIPEVE